MISEEHGIGLTRRSSGWIKQRDCHLVHLNQMKHVSEKRGMHFKSRLVQTISEHCEYVLDQGEEVLLVESLGNVGCSSYVLKQFVQDFKSSVGNVSFRVLHGPYDCVDD